MRSEAWSEVAGGAGGSSGRVLSVSEVTRAVKGLLESSFPRILVRGEVTNLSRPQSGHIYFSLVDDAKGPSSSRLTSSQLSCVVWKSSLAHIRRRFENGDRVIVSGRIGVYEPRGAYQLVGDHVEPAGLGELQLRFEELKARLRLEGLFDPARKRPLPYFPKRIGLITSPTGAAIRDVLRVLYRRHPRAWVRIVPVRVQGLGAAEEIARAVGILEQDGGLVDVIVLARGGGSLEDLWAFNEEVVARALARCPIPTVSAVGHEVDFSIADFVADARAQTPTHAAELLVPDTRELELTLFGLARRMSLAIESSLELRDTHLARLAGRRPLREPRAVVEELFERCDDVGRGLKIHLYNLRRRWEDSLSGASGRLEALNPLKVLARGWSLVTLKEGPGDESESESDGATVEPAPGRRMLEGVVERVVSDASLLQVGQCLRIRMARGAVRARVVATEDGGDGPIKDGPIMDTEESPRA